MNEQGPKSLEQLQTRQAKLSLLVEQRHQLYDAIGTGVIREATSPDYDIKVGRVKYPF